ncbi:MAG TPA: Clp protease N-terminal domain-containing protein [bacterium]|nr:Clp protease N-terminal domain-containing protein [bacterium]
MFERMSESLRNTIIHASKEAAALGAEAVGPEHLLASIAAQSGSVASSVLAEAGVTPEAIRRAIEAEDAETLATIGISLDAVRRKVEQGMGEKAWSQPMVKWNGPFTQAGKDAILSTIGVVRKLRRREITPEHLLLALLEHSLTVDAVLNRIGVSRAEIRQRIFSEVSKS